MSLQPTPSENKCSACGHEGLDLALEVTEYRPARFENGQWSCGYVTETLPGSCSADEDRIRMFCGNCGIYFKAPEGI